MKSFGLMTGSSLINQWVIIGFDKSTHLEKENDGFISNQFCYRSRSLGDILDTN